MCRSRQGRGNSARLKLEVHFGAISLRFGIRPAEDSAELKQLGAKFAQAVSFDGADKCLARHIE